MYIHIYIYTYINIHTHTFPAKIHVKLFLVSLYACLYIYTSISHVSLTHTTHPCVPFPPPQACNCRLLAPHLFGLRKSKVVTRPVDTRGPEPPTNISRGPKSK